MWTTILEGFPKDATYLYVNTSLLLENGQDATIQNGVYTHHLGFYDVDKGGPALSICSGLTPPKPSLFTGGAEDKGDNFFTTPDGTFNSGYYVAAQDRVMVTSEIINYKDAPVKVFSEVELEYVPGRIRDAQEVNIQSFSVTGCSLDLAITPAKNTTTMILNSQEFPVLQDGYILSSSRSFYLRSATGSDHLQRGICMTVVLTWC